MACAGWRAPGRDGACCPMTSAVGGGLSADATLDPRGGVRDDSPRSARGAASSGGARRRADGGDPRLAHAAILGRERRAGRVRRGEAQAGIEGASCRGYARPLPRAACLAADVPARAGRCLACRCRRRRATMWRWRTSIRDTRAHNPPRMRRRMGSSSKSSGCRGRNGASCSCRAAG